MPVCLAKLGTASAGEGATSPVISSRVIIKLQLPYLPSVVLPDMPILPHRARNRVGVRQDRDTVTAHHRGMYLLDTHLSVWLALRAAPRSQLGDDIPTGSRSTFE